MPDGVFDGESRSLRDDGNALFPSAEHISANLVPKQVKSLVILRFFVAGNGVVDVHKIAGFRCAG